MRRWFNGSRNVESLVVAGALTALSSGCIGESTAVVRPSGGQAGNLRLTWTVEGESSENACRKVGASEVEVTVYDESGTRVATIEAPCEDFDATLGLPEGTYHADVKLVDADRNPASTTLPLEDLDVREGTELTSDIDFPKASIL